MIAWHVAQSSLRGGLADVSVMSSRTMREKRSLVNSVYDIYLWANHAYG